jgi:hypothetical protein
MARSTIEKRRKMRELEAKRDAHLVSVKKSRAALASVRAEIKHMRAN